MILVESLYVYPLRLAVQVYCPAWDVVIAINMRSLETVCPLVIDSSGVGVTPPGPSHWKSGVSVTPLGRVTVQVRVTMSPAMIEEGEEVREMMDDSEGDIRESVDSLCRDGTDMRGDAQNPKSCSANVKT